MKVYPIKFRPILKEKIWGGQKLSHFLNKDSKSLNLGESWELSGVKGSVSVVSNGVYKSITLMELIKEFKTDFLGKAVYNEYEGEFPLLFKFIDASDDLSIQVHPDDKLARERHDSFGKTEMWYVLDADKSAKLYAGLNKEIDEKEYLSFKGSDLLDVVYVDEVKKDDAFFIKSGTIHAIGKGILLAEIQQTSDVTYRLYDWGRLGLDGESRELHNDMAVDAIEFSRIGSCKLTYNKEFNSINNVFDCNYFTTNKLIIQGEFQRDFSNIESFVVYMCVSGNAVLKVDDSKESISKGETILIPALCKKMFFSTTEGVELLEVFIK